MMPCSSITLTDARAPRMFRLTTMMMAAVVLPTAAALAAESTFDKGAEGWAATGDIQVNVTHFAEGGNPGGHVRVDDATTGGIMYWVAPAKFLGDQSAAYGTMLEFDLVMFITGSYDPTNNHADVRLISPGLTLNYETDIVPLPAGTWLSYDVPLTETGWRVGNFGGEPATQEQMQAVLSNLTGLQIRAEYQDGPDIDGLDNVRMGPVPELCPADINDSGAVDVDDLIAVILDWGCTGASCTADADDDNVVDVDDLIAVILAWGACP